MMKKVEFRIPEDVLSELDKARTNGPDKYISRNSYLIKVVMEFLTKLKSNFNNKAPDGEDTSGDRS